MSKVLNLFRRRGAADAEARAQRSAAPAPAATAPQPPPPQPPSQPLPAPASGPANPLGTSEDGGAPCPAAAPDNPPPELTVVARRQSQLNLNKFLAAAPSGLNAVLKNPSRGDLEASRSQGSVTLTAAQQQPFLLQSQPGAGGESPPVKPARERRRSMMASELAATLQNIDVSQAALIMMPARMRQELDAQQSVSQPLPIMPSAPLQMRSSVPFPPGSLPGALSADSYSLVAVMGGSGAAGVPTASGPQPRLERKPSLLREAVKQQLMQQIQMMQPSSPPRTESGGTMNGSAGAGGGGGGPDLIIFQQQQQLLFQGSLSPPAGSSAQRGPGGGVASGRRGAGGPGHSSGQASVGSVLGGPSRASIAPGMGPPSGLTHGSQRRSEVGESPVRGRGGFEPPGVVPVPVLTSNGGHPLSPTGTGNGNYLLPGAASSNKDLRRVGLPTRGSEMTDDDGPLGSVSSSQAEVRLPVISAAGAPAGRRDAKDKDASVAAGGGRGGLTAADVAALSEAISSYQSEAARLRAMAVRKVDSRIKRAVMDRRLTADEDAGAGPGSLLEGSLAGSLLAPLMRGQGANGNARANGGPAARGGPRGGAGTAGPGAGGGSGAAGGGAGMPDSVARARSRLQETEAETESELSHLRRHSNLGPRLIAADLMADPSVPRRR